MNRISAWLTVFVFLALLVGGFLVTSSASAQCFASGDVNNDGVVLTVGDMVDLMRYLEGIGPAPVHLYEADLNGDCVIDARDVDTYMSYFNIGMPIFPTFPVPTCCDPDTVHGACCVSSDSCRVLSPAHCAEEHGRYHGNGTVCMGESWCKCGDVDQSGGVDISDVVAGIFCIFFCDPTPMELEVNCDGAIDISDIVYLVEYIFGHGPAPCAGCK